MSFRAAVSGGSSGSQEPLDFSNSSKEPLKEPLSWWRLHWLEPVNLKSLRQPWRLYLIMSDYIWLYPIISRWFSSNTVVLVLLWKLYLIFETNESKTLLWVKYVGHLSTVNVTDFMIRFIWSIRYLVQLFIFRFIMQTRIIHGKVSNSLFQTHTTII